MRFFFSFFFFWTNNGIVATDHMLQFTFGCVLLLMSLQQKSPKNPQQICLNPSVLSYNLR